MIAITIPFRWAWTGGFLARTADSPTRPIMNAAESALYATLFATRTGQLLMAGVGGALLRGASATAGAVAGSSVVGVTLGAGAGAVTGAAIGTGISSIAFGPEGKQKAIDFYTGQSGASWYEYIPHYNAGRIVKHYVVG